MNGNKLHSLWDAFPLVMCINLKERPERRAEAREELKRAGLKQVLFFLAERTEDGLKGCYDSHMACLEKAVQLGVSYALIFEDDILFQEGFAEGVQRAIDFVRERSDWNLFYLGGFSLRRSRYVGKHIVRGAFLTSHAYIVRTEYAKRLLAEHPSYLGVTLDCMYTIANGNRSFLSVNPMPIAQRVSQSDTGWDKDNRVGSGWWVDAMLYTSLTYRERLRFNRWTTRQKLKMENGLPILIIWRRVCQIRLALAERRRRKNTDAILRAGGEFEAEEL